MHHHDQFSPRDAEGFPVPGSLRTVFAARERFENWCHRLAELRGELGKICDEYAAWAIPALGVSKDISRLEYLVRDAMPYAPCGCSSMAPCTDCKSKRWLTLRQYREREKRAQVATPLPPYKFWDLSPRERRQTGHPPPSDIRVA